MRRAIILLVFAGLWIIATACSSGQQGQDPAKIKVELSTDPVTVQAGQKVKLTATIAGLVKEEGANVQIDIRKSDNSLLPDTKDAQTVGNGQYSAEKIFDKPGTYSIYIHLYQGDLHITKKKELEVS
ncbi:hypothetical protein SK3146_00368 [Paenibacillus konkukensis]|uniref:YtkA-like domain-containing protein n=1 Tax=Paenibacillus konkukensis TaxID=2020716 RepID=A0ABY4RG04_9BACL|nr:FixH family protein [Paenibacillus konkukensis]UQZ81212.1 hypothetical protein SK3146_00368 [Paenibacillus konkukensis]